MLRLTRLLSFHWAASLLAIGGCLFAADSQAQSKDDAVSVGAKLLKQFTDQVKPSTQPGSTQEPQGTSAQSATNEQSKGSGQSAGSSAAFDPMQPPKRLVGAQGVRLGMQAAEAFGVLENRGWKVFTSGSDTFTFKKGTSGLQMLVDQRKRVHTINFWQEFQNPSEGKFDIEQTRAELIPRYGPPMYDTFESSTPQQRSKVDQAQVQAHLQWSESPHATSYKQYMQATAPQKAAINNGPRLDAVIGRTVVRLNFTWRALPNQISEDYTRQREAEKAAAPTKKLSIDQ
jgi:hypothetical protein